MKKIILGLVLVLLAECRSAEHQAAIDQCQIETGFKTPLEKMANNDTWRNCLVRNGWNREEIAREAAKQQAQKDQQERQVQAYMNQLRSTCRAFGFSENTDPFRNCLMSQHQSNIAAIQSQKQIDAANSAARATNDLAYMERMKAMNELTDRLNPNSNSYYLRNQGR